MVDYKKGYFAKSLAGHDKGKLYIVIEEKNDSSDFVFLSDGELKPMDKPKKKRTKHIQVIKTVDLRIDQEFTVENGNHGYNAITVRDGKIGVSEATCPDHYCMKRGYCNSGTEIVCLPNRLVIRFLGEQEIDAIVG